MWYRIDINLLVWLLLSFQMRKPKIAAFIFSLVSPLKSLHFKWRKYREDNLYNLQHNGQVCYLRKALNDQFDPTLRRIRIGAATRRDTVYIFKENEEQNEPHAYTEDEDGTIWIFTEGETEDGGADFVVYVPTDIVSRQDYELRALIDFYKLGGKRYIIITE